MIRDLAIAWMIGLGLVALLLAFGLSHGHAADRPCTAADVARFEKMFGGRGSYHSDARFQVTIHYLGTSTKNGTCYVAVRPAS